MYGRRLPLRLVVRCPTGGSRGYGPTHSQSLQKHFIGVPGLSLYEMSPFHDNRAVFAAMLERGRAVRVLRGQGPLHPADGPWCDPLFRCARDGDLAVVELHDADDCPDCVIIAPGGMAHRALAAMRSLLVEQEIACRLLVPSRLYPFDVDTLLPLLGDVVLVAEESTAGGTWGSEVAHLLHAASGTACAGPSASSTPGPTRDPHRRAPGESRCWWGSPRSTTPYGRPCVADIRVPKLNNNDTEYLIVEWLVEDGRPSAPGDPVAVLETSKAADELEAEESGYLHHAAALNTWIAPGAVLARVTPEATPPLAAAPSPPEPAPESPRPPRRRSGTVPRRPRP